MVNEDQYEDDADLMLLRISQIMASHLVYIFDDNQSDDIEGKVNILKQMGWTEDSFGVPEELDSQRTPDFEPVVHVFQMLTSRTSPGLHWEDYWAQHCQLERYLQIKDFDRATFQDDKGTDYSQLAAKFISRCRESLLSIHIQLTSWRNTKIFHGLNIDFFIAIFVIQKVCTRQKLSDFYRKSYLEDM